MRVDEVVRLKLGQVNTGPADAFVQDFIDISEPHPFNSKSRLLGGTAIELSRFGNRVHISDIVGLQPGEGKASQSMRLLISLAQRHNVVLELIAKAYRDDRMSTEQLVQWYKRLGFQPMENLDEIDIDDGVEMRYYP